MERSIQDRYKKIIDSFGKKTVVEGKLSVIGGYIGEVEELMAVMKEARGDNEKETKALKAAEAKRSKDKERIGRELVQGSFFLRNIRSDERENGKEDGSAKKELCASSSAWNEGETELWKR